MRQQHVPAWELAHSLALVPEPMRPGWPEALAMRASRLPHRNLALAEGGSDGGQDEIARAMDDLLTRTGTGPAPAQTPLASRLVTARTRAATANLAILDGG